MIKKSVLKDFMSLMESIFLIFEVSDGGVNERSRFLSEKGEKKAKKVKNKVERGRFF